MSIILAQNPTAMCRVPYGAHVQPINTRLTSLSWTWFWPSPTNTLYLLSFQSRNTGDTDFRIRYCCPKGSFVAPTISTTTPRPLDSTTCGKQTIAPRSKSISRIFGGTNAIPNSWPWVSVNT